MGREAISERMEKRAASDAVRGQECISASASAKMKSTLAELMSVEQSRLDEEIDSAYMAELGELLHAPFQHRPPRPPRNTRLKGQTHHCPIPQSRKSAAVARRWAYSPSSSSATATSAWPCWVSAARAWGKLRG